MMKVNRGLCLIVVLLMCSLTAACGKVDEVSQKVMNDIDSIGDVSLDDEELIQKTISEYATLTDSQKKQVSNYVILLNADEELNKLKKESEELLVKSVKNSVNDIYECAILCEDIINSIEKLWDENITLAESVYENDETWNYSKEYILPISSSWKYKIDDIEETRENLTLLKDSNSKVLENNKSINNWPANMREEENNYESFYDVYLDLYELSTNPSGNYKDYCSKANELINDFVTQYNKLKPYIE